MSRPNRPFGRPNHRETSEEDGGDVAMGGMEGPPPVAPPPARGATLVPGIALPNLPRPVVPLVQVPTPASNRKKDRRESLLNLDTSWWNAPGQARTNPPSDRCFRCCSGKRVCNLAAVGYPCSECLKHGPAAGDQCRNGVPTVGWENRIREEDRVARANGLPLGFAPTAIGPPGPGPPLPTVADAQVAAGARTRGRAAAATATTTREGVQTRASTRASTNSVSNRNIRRAVLRNDRPARRRSASPERSPPGSPSPPRSRNAGPRVTIARCKECERTHKRCNDTRPCNQCLRRGLLCEDQEVPVRGMRARGQPPRVARVAPQPTPRRRRRKPYRFGRCQRCARLSSVCGDERPCNRCSNANVECVEQNAKPYPVLPGQPDDNDDNDDEDLSMYDNGENRLGDDDSQDDDDPYVPQYNNLNFDIFVPQPVNPYLPNPGDPPPPQNPPRSMFDQNNDTDVMVWQPGSPPGTNPFQPSASHFGDDEDDSPRDPRHQHRAIPIRARGNGNNGYQDLGVQDFEDMMAIIHGNFEAPDLAQDAAVAAGPFRPGRPATPVPLAQVPDAPNISYEDLYPRERDTPFFHLAATALGDVGPGEGFGGNRQEGPSRPFWEAQAGEANWVGRARAAQDNPHGPAPYYGQQFDPPNDFGDLDLDVPPVASRPPGAALGPWASYSFDGSFITRGPYRWPFPEIDPVNNERPLHPLTYQDLVELPCSEDAHHFDVNRVPEHNFLPCGKQPSRECEVTPQEDLRHMTRPMQTCYQCHEDQLASCFDHHVAGVERTKSWLCVDCAHSAKRDNATRPQCNCTASRLGSWLCHAHRDQVDGRVEGAVMQAEE